MIHRRILYSIRTVALCLLRPAKLAGASAKIIDANKHEMVTLSVAFAPGGWPGVSEEDRLV